MNWKIQIENEIKQAERALKEGNDGRARTCARRAAGIALKEYDSEQNHPDRKISSIDRLREISTNENLPDKIRKAAQRLITNVNNRLSENFTFHPIRDANIIIEYFSS